MQNKLNEGKAIKYTNATTAAVIAGTPVYLGAGVGGVAVDDIPANATGVLDLEGAFNLPKAAVAISAGKPVKISSGVITNSISTVANTLNHETIGVSLEAATATGSGTIKVLLK